MSAKRAALITIAMLVAMVGVATGIGANSQVQATVAADGYGVSAHHGATLPAATVVFTAR